MLSKLHKPFKMRISQSTLCSQPEQHAHPLYNALLHPLLKGHQDLVLRVAPGLRAILCESVTQETICLAERCIGTEHEDERKFGN